MEFAKERGELVATLQQKRNHLEVERGRIMEDLKHVRKGNLGAVRKNVTGILAGSQILSRPELPNNKTLTGDVRKMNEK